MTNRHRCKRIIDGKTYNTETATQIGGWDDSDEEDRYVWGDYLYQTRFGAFFRHTFSVGNMEDDSESIKPLSPDEARAWLEEKMAWKPELIEDLFGEMPEAGSNEAKFTLRMPEVLRDRLAAKARDNKQSLNAWMVRCLENCAGDDKTNKGT